MSVLRPMLSRRGRLALVAAALLLLGTTLVAAPSVSGAPAAVKQFTATISPNTAVSGDSGTWTLQVKNCGTPIEAPCTAASTIAIGQVRITVPPEFRPITLGTVSASGGNNWTASYSSGTGIIVARAVTGSDKLASGELVDIPFTATPSPATCTTGSKEFTTTAVGGLPAGPDNQTFAIVGSQPSVTLGCALESGDTITDPVTGQTETITGDFAGHVNVIFGGDTGPDCGGAEFEALGDQWSEFHLPTQVNITPGDGFMAGVDPKVSTSTFTPAPGADSSWYLICYAVPVAGHTAFTTRGGGPATVQDIDGTAFFVGILPNCPIGVLHPEPCVSEQFLTFTTPHKVVISVRMQPGDPFKK